MMTSACVSSGSALSEDLASVFFLKKDASAPACLSRFADGLDDGVGSHRCAAHDIHRTGLLGDYRGRERFNSKRPDARRFLLTDDFDGFDAVGGNLHFYGKFTVAAGTAAE